MTAHAEPIVGANITRVEDARLLTGQGQYVDDVNLPGMLHAAFLRSPLPHARIEHIDASRARTAPGVHAVLTAADLEGVVKPIHFQSGIDGHKVPAFTALTGDKVRFVGDPIAVVIAETRALAEDALEEIIVDYEPLPAVLTAEGALAPDAPVVFDELDDNVIYRAHHEYGDLAGEFGRAHTIVTATTEQQRITSCAMETRGIVVDTRSPSEEMTCFASTKAPHMLRMRLAEYLGHDQNDIRVIARDVGGAFGGKGAVWREDLVIGAASKALGRPVKWIEDRVENLTAFGGARDQAVRVEAAVEESGKILALRVQMVMNHGAYPGMWLTPMFAALVRCTMLSALKVDTFSFETAIAATNKNTYISYRGPGAIETLIRERTLDAIAEQLGLDPVDVRRVNLLSRKDQPWKMPTGATVDRAHARETLERAVEVVGYEEARRHQEEARASGRHVGIGVATSIQPCPAFPDWWESIGYPNEPAPARIRLEQDGRVTATISEMPTGQGLETTLAQVAASAIGVPFEHVRVVLGDTHLTPYYYFGTGASRSSNMGAGAVLTASRRLREQLIQLAAAQLGVSAESLDLVEGRVCSSDAGGDVDLPLASLARTVYSAGGADQREAVDVLAYYQPGPTEGGWAASTHICIVEVDPRYGTVAVDRYLVVEDCGVMINPSQVEGQIRGGIAQGIGAVFQEHAAYDQDGNFVTATLMGYLPTTAQAMPEIEIEHLEIPSDEGFGARGVGESGMVMAPAALVNAVNDAIRPLDGRIDVLPITPTSLLEAIGAIEPQELGIY